MRWALFADIHSNLEAFKAVVADMGSAGVEGKRFLGDVCGYGYAPVECLDLLMDILGEGDTGNKGNHDDAVIFGKAYGFHGMAADVVAWQVGVLNDLGKKKKKYLDFLQSLNDEIEDDKYHFVHGGPEDSINQYILAENFGGRGSGGHLSYSAVLKLIGNKRLFGAHSHDSGVHFDKVWTQIPEHCYIQDVWHPILIEPQFEVLPEMIQRELNKPYGTDRRNAKALILEIQEGKDFSGSTSDTIALPADSGSVVIVGSAGQPRDYDPRARYVIYDDVANTVEFRRVPYDIGKAISEMDKVSAIHPMLSDRLKVGQ